MSRGLGNFMKIYKKMIWQDQRSASLFQWRCLRRPNILCFAKECLDQERRPGYSPGPRKRGFYGGQDSGAYRDVSGGAGPIGTRSVPGPTGCTAISPCRMLSCWIFAKAVPPASLILKGFCTKLVRSCRQIVHAARLPVIYAGAGANPAPARLS